MGELVAVYGTLKEDYPNHHVMVRSGGRLIGKGETLSKWTMYSLGGFPAIVPDDVSPVNISVEVFEVDTLTYLDSLEGYPGFYNRKKEKITLDNSEVDAYIYYINYKPVGSTPVLGDGVW